MIGINENIKQKINDIIKNFSKGFLSMRNNAAYIFSLEYGVSPNKPDGLCFITLNEKERAESKEEMIQRLKNIFYNYPRMINYLKNLAEELTSKVVKKDPFYYGLINNINEYISKINNIAFDCQRIDKYYKLNTSNNLPDIKNYSYKEYSLEFKYMIHSKIKISISFLGYKIDNEENYDNNIDVKELKSKCGKTCNNNHEIISNGYTMVCRSFEINKNLREDGIDSLNESDRKVINALLFTCMSNLCYKNMILYRFVDQNFIKDLFGIEFLNDSESSASDAVSRLLNYWGNDPIKVEGGFISSSYLYTKNLFQDRDILLKLYVSYGTPIYATDNDQESEVIITAGISYIFFDAYYETISRFNKNCYRIVIKAFIKPPNFNSIQKIKNPPPIIHISMNP